MSSVRYQSLGPLMSGEGSRAFLGLALEDGSPPRPVVLVWAPQDVVQNPELSTKLERETQRALVFEHPNILRVYALAAQDGGLARVTEFADGEPLRRVLEAQPRLPPPFAALVAADAATGLHYAHLAGNDDGSPLVHGDVRPETLMVSFRGVTKVSGYGALSVAPRERGGLRVKNRRMYSAPEQLLGGRDAVQVQSDVFLLGLVLHECLTGKIPFKETVDPDKAVLTRPLPPVPGDVPLKLDAVVRKATAKRAYERYRTALEFREAVVEAMGTLPTHEQFAEFLGKLFPPESEARATRRRVIETGIADVLAKVGVPTAAVAELLAQGTLPAGVLPASWPVLPGQLPAAMGGAAPAVSSGAPVTGSHVLTTTGATATVAPGTATASPQGAPSGSHAQIPAAGAQPVASQGAPSGTHALTPAGAQSVPNPGAPSGTHAQIPAAGAQPVASQGAPSGAHAQVPASGAQSVSQAQPPTTAITPVSPPVQGVANTSGAPVASGTGSASASSSATGGATAPAFPSSTPPPVHPAPQKSFRPWAALVAVGVVLMLGAVAVVLKRLPPNIEAGIEDGGALASVAPLPGDTLLLDAGTQEDAGTTNDCADAGMGMLDIFVEPRVDVSLQGTVLGRTPLAVPLPPGKHVLTLTNPVLGIQVQRSVVVAPTGRSSLQVYLNKGFVNVRAPKDAIVTMDGRLVGAAPVEELDVYEGTHQLLVMVKQARWQKTFKIEPGQRISFDVEFEEPPPEE